MSVVADIFKAYDIRGKVGTELTEQLAENVGRGFADWLPNEGPVAVGRDMRPDSAGLAKAAIEGLTAQGRDVWDIGQVTSDMIYFAVGEYNLAGGMMVTASHNPGEYNGIKLCREGAGGVSLDAGLDEVRDAALSGSFKPNDTTGEATEKSVVEAWVDHALNFAGEGLRPLKIAVDAGNGMAGAIVPHLDGKTPFEITPLYFELDGTFPNHEANPLKKETLKDLQKTVLDYSLDAGIAFDGDGDRAVLVDETGQPISGSVTTALLADYFLENNPGATILHNAICSRVVPETIQAAGGTAIRTRVGHSYIKQKMREHDAVFAGEHSAHYYFRDNFSADSGLIAAVTALGVLSRSQRPLSELVDQYKTYVASGEVNFEVEDKQAATEQAKEAFADGTIDELDGLTVNYDNWWFNLRPSNTEPLLRLNVEAKTQELLDQKLNELSRLIDAHA